MSIPADSARRHPDASSTDSEAHFKLSICISTLNRAAFIGETLQSIVPQLVEGVELLIVDGASTDDTPSIVQSFQESCRRVRYVRLQKNNGLDADFDHAVALAHGRYCWLMTDDDLLLPGAVEAALNGINAGHDMIVINSEVRNANLTEVIQDRRMPINEDRSFTPATWNEFAQVAGSYLSFIGGVVIRRSLWLERDRAAYYGTLFVHIGVIFQERVGGTCLVIAAPFISIRYGNAMWRPREFEIWMFKWPRLIWSFQSLSQTSKAAISPRSPWTRWNRVLYYRAKGTYSMVEYRNHVLPAEPSFAQRLPALVAANFPGRLANVIAYAACLLFPSKAGLRLLDLRASRFYPFRR
ncbi:MAG: glycosyltransferase family 2 protein [Pseudomonadota bacterium]